MEYNLNSFLQFPIEFQMKGFETQLKSMKSEWGPKISHTLRIKIDKYNSLLRQMIKNPIFKILEDTPDASKARKSIDAQVLTLKKQIESEIKLDMTDYESFLWKLDRIYHHSKPLFFDRLQAIQYKPFQHQIEKIKKDFNYPILNCKNKELIMMASQLLETNQFCSQNYKAKTILNLVYQLNAGYKIVPYHNFTHAFSVFMMLYQSQENSLKLRELFSPFQFFIGYISALAHDINHNGFNSGWEIKNKTQIAMMYNNESVLENMHVSELYNILRKNPDVDFLSKMKSSTQRQNAKRLISKLILATDITFHRNHLDKLNQISTISQHNKLSLADKEVIYENLFHGCDIGNPCLCYDNYLNWSILLAHQFDHQAAMEKKSGFQVSPNFQWVDIKTHYKRQIGFIEFLALPLWKQLGNIIPQLKNLQEKILQNRQILKNKQKEQEASKQ